MKQGRLIGIAAALLVVIPQLGVGEEYKASGTWKAGKKTGSWSATLSRDGDLISGQMELQGLPVRRAEVAGTLRADEITFGLVHSDREIMSFQGRMNMSRLGGTLTLANGTAGEWSGAWEAESTFVPVTNGLSGALVPPFDRGLDRPALDQLPDVCELLSSKVRGRMSGGGETALRRACGIHGRPESAPPGTPDTLQSTGGVSCSPGLPESNPPTPGTVAGVLANNVSRPLQQWPRITQSEVTAAVSFVNSQHQAVAFNDTQFTKEKCSFIGHAYLSPTNGWTENPDQFVVPTFFNGSISIAPASDPTSAPDSEDRFHLAYLALKLGSGFNDAIVAPVQVH